MRSLAGFAFILSLSTCGGSSIDAHRLTVLSREPLATAEAPGTTTWIPTVDTADAVRRNGRVGSDNGIGFGGASSTQLLITRHRSGSPAAALRFYAEIAIRSGWRIFQINCDTNQDSFGASKQYPGWVGSADVGTLPFKGEPAVTLDIETDYHRGGSARVLPKPRLEPLTVQGLNSTCIGGAP